MGRETKLILNSFVNSTIKELEQFQGHKDGPERQY